MWYGLGTSSKAGADFTAAATEVLRSASRNLMTIRGAKR